MMSNSESLFPLIVRFGMLIFLGIFIWGILDTTFLLKRTGKIKRGIKIWSEPLPATMHTFLENLTDEIIEKRKYLFFSSVVGFILAKNGEVLIQYRRKGWGTSWPYVGYVDLRQTDPRIEYRVSLPMHLVLLPFILSIVAIPFIGVLMGVNYYMERNAILNFVHKQVPE